MEAINVNLKRKVLICSNNMYKMKGENIIANLLDGTDIEVVIE